MTKLSRISVAIALAPLILSATARAGTLYVNANLATGANDGTSWSNAFRGPHGLQAALAAAVSGDEIWAARGAYKPTSGTDRTVSFQLKNGVTVYGAFAGGETSPDQRPPFWTSQSFLFGDLNGDDGSGLYNDNSYHVVDAAGTNATAVLDGFTVASGNANGANPNDRGGGILCQGGDGPTLRNCRFLFNRATSGGGAGYVDGSSPTFIRCNFESNVGGSFGGAVDCNTTSTTWDRCYFTGNTAARAGALELFGAGTPRVLNCLFYDNTSTGPGGGGAIWTSANSLIRNCTIVRNSSSTNETAGILASGGAPSIVNCILWENRGPGGAQGSANQITGTTAVTYSIVEGGFAGTGNLGLDPRFEPSPGVVFALRFSSPAVDAGNNAGLPAGFTLDWIGNARLVDDTTVPDTGAGAAPIVDIGAVEWQAPAIVAFCFGDGLGTPCPCGNHSTPGDGGCQNSLGTGGRLASSGVARILADTFVLQGSQMPDGTCLYFQGTTHVNAGLGAPFGDGLRCVAGTVVRLGTKTNVGGASQYPGPGDLPVSVRGGIVAAGTARMYQVWYRNVAAFCTADTSNLTDALRVVWDF